MKHIAKNRPGRLAAALASFASSVRRTVGDRAPRGTLGARTTLTRASRLRPPSTAAARLALVPARLDHFDWIASLLAEGAAEGSFESDLATDSPASRLFFANLRRTLQTGTFLSQREDGQRVETPASGYVFALERSHGQVPIGFALFKSIGGLGFELWLAGIDRRYRRRGFATAMLRAALQTPAGMLAHVARINRGGRHAEAMGKAVRSVGYRLERDGPAIRWFVRQDAPQAVARAVRKG